MASQSKPLCSKEARILAGEHGPLEVGRDLLDRRPDHEFLRLFAVRTVLGKSVFDHRCRRRVLGPQLADRWERDQLIRQPHGHGADEYKKTNFCPIPHMKN